MSVDRSGERLRGSEQFRADGDSSKRGRRQGADFDTEQGRASCDRLRGNLRPERPLNLKTSFQIKLNRYKELCTIETASIYLTFFVILQHYRDCCIVPPHTHKRL